jgi:multidrug efflux system membrane fusion protein
LVKLKRRTLVGLGLGVLAVAAAAWYISTRETTTTTAASSQDGGRGGRGGRFGAGQPTPVGMVAATKGEIPIVIKALGTVTPLATVTVKSQITGQLVRVEFTEGQMVKQGDLLAEVDPRPYEVALQQTLGQLQRDEALLKNAQIDLQRYQTLVRQDSIARQQFDTQAALVRQYEAAIVTDQALVDNARLNLAYTKIIAPVTGRIGLRQVDKGNYVSMGDATGICVITQVQPISVLFTIPEDFLPQVRKRVTSGAKLEVRALDRAQKVELGIGTLSTTDNQIDTTTGTVKLRAMFENKAEDLFPNQFVNIRLLVDTVRDATVIPMAAIQRGQPGIFVYLVKADDTVEIRVVELGATDGERVAITKGLQVGDNVVIDGMDRLREGAKVRRPEAGGGRGTRSGTPPAAQPGAQPGTQPNAEAPVAAAPPEGAQPQRRGPNGQGGERGQGERGQGGRRGEGGSNGRPPNATSQ